MMAAPPAALKADNTSLLQPAGVSLLKRGQYREQYLKAHQNGVPRGSLRRARSRHLSATAFTRSTRNMLAAGDDHLEDLLKGVVASINSPEHLPQSEKDALILQGVLGLWMRRHEARGFRRWKESTLNRVDLQTLIVAGVNVHEEARQLLLAAETKRRMLANERRTPLNSHDDDESWMAANFSYAEMDLLLAWARHTQPKTCRGVDDNTLREALRYLRFNQYQDGEAIFFQGDKGDVFYLVLDGNVGIYGAKRTQPTEKHKRKQSVRGDSAAKKSEGVKSIRERPDMNLMGPRIFTYRAGESFGETALFTNAAVRTATAIAFGTATSGSSSGSVCELGEISRGQYSRTLKRFHQHFFTQAQRVNFAQRVFLFKDWPRPRVVEVAEVLELRRISFGSVLLTEGVTPLSHCFFVLSGTVNITTQLEVKSPMADEPQALQQAAVLKKARRRNQITIELHTVRVGEIVALEALLEDEDSTARLAYTAVASSADVEVYALKRTDGRAFLVDNPTNNILDQVHTICATERAHREERIEIARRALSEREDSNKKHRLELESEALELGLTDKQQHQRHKQQELEDIDKNSTPRAFLGLQRPFLPHMDPVKLLVGVDENNVAKITTGEPRVLTRSIEIDTSLGEVAAPPKLLSTLVKNFIVRDGDTLADDYAQRLTLQFPVRSPLSPLVYRTPLTCRPDTMALTQMHTARRRHAPVSTMSATFYDELQTRDAHIRQLSVNYDAKMHWNPKKKNFVLVQTVPSNEVRQETTGDQNLQTKLHYQLRTAQISAPKLSVELTRKQNEYSGPPKTFVHFC